jgi:hypothetical protein
VPVKTLPVVLAVLTVLGPARAADECPAPSNTMDDIIAVLEKSSGCDAAMKIFQACSFGTSGDIRFGAAVETRCEADFAGRLKPAQKAGYRRELQACDRKYQNEAGTMYRSFTAFCRSEVAQRHAKRARIAAGASR